MIISKSRWNQGIFLAFNALRFLILPSVASAQLIDVNSVTRAGNPQLGYTYPTWKPVLSANLANTATSNSGILLDPINDQQTGQGDSDFVSSVNGGVVNPGFFFQFGTINYGGTNVEHVAFRAIMNEFKTTGNIVNIRFAFDGNSDGKLDLYIGISQQNNQLGIIFNYPNNLASPTANTSPNTTDWATTTYPTANRAGLPALNSTNNALNLVTGSNFSQILLADGVVDNGLTGQDKATPTDNRATYYPGWVTQAEGQNKINLDSMVTFAVPLQDINNALTLNNAGFALSRTTPTRWAAVTSTQNNSVNQDAYGFSGLTGTWSEITPLVDGNGEVPEPSTFGSVFAASLLFLIINKRPRRLKTVA